MRRLNHIEQIIFNEIELHRGRDSAISVPILTSRVNIYFNGDPLNEVQVRKIVRDLINEHGMPIGSATDPPPGYYITISIRELEEAVRKQRKRGLETLKRASRLESNGRKYFSGQLRLEFRG